MESKSEQLKEKLIEESAKPPIKAKYSTIKAIIAMSLFAICSALLGVVYKIAFFEHNVTIIDFTLGRSLVMFLVITPIAMCS